MACSPVPRCSHSRQQQTGEWRLESGSVAQGLLARGRECLGATETVAVALGLPSVTQGPGDIANSNVSVDGEKYAIVPLAE